MLWSSSPTTQRFFALCRQQPDEPVLGMVRVLVLVDQDMVKHPLIVAEHVLMLLKELYREHEQVVEIKPVGLP